MTPSHLNTEYNLFRNARSAQVTFLICLILFRSLICHLTRPPLKKTMSSLLAQISEMNRFTVQFSLQYLPFVLLFDIARHTARHEFAWRRRCCGTNPTKAWNRAYSCLKVKVVALASSQVGIKEAKGQSIISVPFEFIMTKWSEVQSILSQ